MSKEYERISACVAAIREKTDFVPDVALILGSGLGAFADQIEQVCSVSYSEIPGFPVSTAPGHAGKYVFGYVGDTKVVVMNGRVHYYEGYDIKDVVLPTRVMGMLGAKVLFVTNAAGGSDPSFNAGDLMIIKDHILTFMRNPLIGENIEEFGPRFPDMSTAYEPEYCEIIKKVAKDAGFEMKEGIYCQLTGPSFETPAEVRMLSSMGIGAVGMSTAVEVVAAKHMGMKVCGISCISNKGAGLSENPLTQEEVIETADRVAPFFRKILWDSILEIGKRL